MGLIKYLRIKDLYHFLKGIKQNRRMIGQLVKKELQSQYLGSFLGITWAFLQPIIFILAIWCVFAIGLKGARVAGALPFILYLIPGMVLWFFFSAALSGSTLSIAQHSYLVKQLIFKINLLPLVKIVSELIIHLVFLTAAIGVFLLHGYYPDIFYLQILYYLAATFIFLQGVAWVTASVYPFFKDIKQIIQIIVRIGFWFTPVFWNIDQVPAKYQVFIKINPVYYLIAGYRDCLVYKKWFWEHPILSLYFWFLTGLLLVIGSIVFRRLKPHFADVL